MTLETPHAASTEDSASAVRPQRGLRPSLFYLIVAIVFLSDQLSKRAIQRTLQWGETERLFGDAFALTLTKNTGGAWGLLPQGNLLFILFAAVAIVALLFAYHRMPRVDLLVGAAFALALGGAVGNLLDRLRYGYVVDFFDARIIHWPIFNIADSAITLGIVLLLLHFLQSRGLETDEATSKQRAPSASLAAEDGGNRGE